MNRPQKIILERPWDGELVSLAIHTCVHGLLGHEPSFVLRGHLVPVRLFLCWERLPLLSRSLGYLTDRCCPPKFVLDLLLLGHEEQYVGRFKPLRGLGGLPQGVAVLLLLLNLAPHRGGGFLCLRDDRGDVSVVLLDVVAGQ